MRVIKGLISLLLIAGIFGIVGLYSQVENLGVVTTFFRELLFQYDWLFYFYQIVLFVLLALLLLAFLLVLFKPITKKEIHIKKDMGQINLPLHTLESIARSSLQEIVNVDDTQVKIRLTKHQTADVEVTVADEKQKLFLSKGKMIQEQIPQALKQMAMLETNKTKVIFKKKKVESTLLPIGKKESRVV
ncbi:alkaline shock response membrane anchor protein AmaP [Candidatus Enterococcus ikei]|uniref:Alkaline shock response membrane anchor protein AmaP n=1 Tax=Candidatus Enterococcus ikei TaxID=2815326 RepID=A0ABS3GU46_9ENTE|nr:alkaline shock response membrane anchor protein AmaP [Enterococcus sp. DIV0869a]MBO0438778.1 alkaline shock response membrane anchor protein AmaP [Enterococcus sp. DIV0869a]